MVEIKNKSQKYIPTTLPHDIIENILSRLPVKSLLRFKSVSKQWEATISDPEFAQIHLQQSKKSSSSQNLFMVVEYDSRESINGEFPVVKLEDNKFHKLTAIAYPQDMMELFLVRLYVICCCDGLLLIRCEDNSCMLWNASSRTYKKFCCPYPIDIHFSNALVGICYDPLIKDYKVVIADMKHYAVFYCRKNHWTEMKEMNVSSYSNAAVICQVICQGEFFNGSFYWLVIKMWRCSFVFEFDIVCLDCRDENFRKLAMPNYEAGSTMFYLASLGGCLCLFSNQLRSTTNEMTIMKKVANEDSWIEFKVPMPVPCSYVHPVCLKNEHEIILACPGGYILYNQNKLTFKKISRGFITEFSHLVPYLENLFV